MEPLQKPAGLVQRIQVQLSHKPGPLHQRDKAARKQNPLLRMAPPGQGLSPRDPPCGPVRIKLDIQLKLLVLHPPLHVLLQLTVLLKLADPAVCADLIVQILPARVLGRLAHIEKKLIQIPVPIL
jgi:hypothetical protein